MKRKIVIVEYYFTASRLLAFTVRSDRDRPAVMAIDVNIGVLAAEIASGAKFDYHDQVASLVRSPALAACMAPIVRWSDVDDVICIIPSGPLFYVPMHAVSVNDSPLISRNAVFYAPAASILRHCVRRRAQVRQFAASVFGNSEGDLISAGKEAGRVSEILRTGARTRQDVTRGSVLEALRSSEIFHFAGHAEFFANDPLASGIVLADGDILSARDILAVTAERLRLVTLSGCVTGYNHIQPGDELLGLTRSFLHAGASSLLLTLWEIADVVTVDIMALFYEHWLNRGMMKVDALRQAQLAAY